MKMASLYVTCLTVNLGNPYSVKVAVKRSWGGLYNNLQGVGS